MATPRSSSFLSIALAFLGHAMSWAAFLITTVCDSLFFTQPEWASNPLKMLIDAAYKAVLMVCFSPARLCAYWLRQAKRRFKPSGYAYQREFKAVNPICIA